MFLPGNSVPTRKPAAGHLATFCVKELYNTVGNIVKVLSSHTRAFRDMPPGIRDPNIQVDKMKDKNTKSNPKMYLLRHRWDVKAVKAAKGRKCCSAEPGRVSC